MDKGAHYYRCDFQVHTPRDANWVGSRPVGDEARAAWAARFVAACREKGLDAVAITDHHDFAMFPYVRRAAQEELDEEGNLISAQQRLVVFPGLELTLSVPCQALLILDADFPDDRLDSVLARLALPVVDPAAAQLPGVTAIDMAMLSTLYAELDKEPWLKDRYIVLPNVTDGGHKTLLRSGMHHKYRDMPCLGGYLDGTVETKVGQGNAKILAGKNTDYGNKRIALFQTSDSRSDTFADLGKNGTWVKWAAPTAEALRQACLAQESRISQVSPGLPNVWISRISVDNSKFLGPVELELNPQFTAFIGGRGTGKSTLLDYLRWALCDLPAGGEDDEEIGDPASRQRRLIATTLNPTDSTVEVHFTINQIPHIVRRSAPSGDLTLKVGTDEFSRARESDIRQLLPIQAYSQKQLSSVSVRIDELTRFVTSSIRRELSTIDQQIAETSARIRENYATLQRHRQLASTIQQGVLSEKSLAEQAANLRASLEDVSDEDRVVLDDKPKYDAAISRAETVRASTTRALESAENSLGALDELIAHPDYDGALPAPLEVPLQEFEATTAGLLKALREATAAATDELRAGIAPGSDHERLYEKIRADTVDFNETYDAVKTRSTAHSTRLAELADVERQQRAATLTLQSQRTELQALGDPSSAHSELTRAMFRLMADRSDRMAEQCEALSDLSGGLLRATLERGQGLTAVAERLRGVVSGSGLRSNRVDEFFAQLGIESDPLATWETAVGELEGLTAVEQDSALTTAEFPTLARLGFPVADLKRIASRLNPDGWLSLALTAVSDHPRFEYQTKENEYIEFASASAGQQATALLSVLLAQPGPPLVIDQPEDDLDSEVVQDIVEKIWDAKCHRQLIFASHNANLVVNGDAELVVQCDYRVRGEQSRGEIKALGAIDLPLIRDAITRVMEGGEKAFRLRANKYGF